MNAATKEKSAELALELEQESMSPPAVVSHTPPAPMRRSPVDVVAELLERGVTVEQLDRFLEIQRKYEAEEARRAFEAAMARFKGSAIGEIKKSKRVSFPTKAGGTMNYKHETLDAVVKAVRIPMSKCGLSHSWDVDATTKEPLILVKCIITHENGHSKSVELPGLPDESGNKNALQQVRSTITFLQRATLLLALGLAAEGEDDDGRQGARNGAPPGGSDEPRAGGPRSKKNAGDRANAGQLKVLRAKLEKTAGVDEPALLKQFKIAKLEELSFDSVNDALRWIEHGG